MPDSVAAYGMRILGNPAGNDDRVISGESGAAGFGAAAEILTREPEIREAIGLDNQSVVLCFSTEGATDITNYRSIVWEGNF